MRFKAWLAQGLARLPAGQTIGAVLASQGIGQYRRGIDGRGRRLCCDVHDIVVVCAGESEAERPGSERNPELYKYIYRGVTFGDRAVLRSYINIIRVLPFGIGLCSGATFTVMVAPFPLCTAYKPTRTDGRTFQCSAAPPPPRTTTNNTQTKRTHAQQAGGPGPYPA